MAPAAVLCQSIPCSARPFFAPLEANKTAAGAAEQQRAAAAAVAAGSERLLLKKGKRSKERKLEGKKKPVSSEQN